MDRTQALPRRIESAAAFFLTAATLSVCLTGCSLFVMAGKMIWGDPKIPCTFRQRTGVDLTREEKKVVVVVSSPQLVKSELPSVDFDLLDGITRRLQRQGVDLADQDKVMTWIDDNGGLFSNPSELARAVQTDYVVHIDIEEMRFHEENSPTLLRGLAGGSVVVYEVDRINNLDQAVQVFVQDFRKQYPELNPVSTHQLSERVFRKRFLDQLADELSRNFYDYRLNTTF